MENYKVINEINYCSNFKEDNKLATNYAKARLGKELQLKGEEDYSKRLIEITSNKIFNTFTETLGDIAYEILNSFVSASYYEDKLCNIFIDVNVNISIDNVLIPKVVDVVIVSKEKIEVIKISSFDYDRINPREDLELRVMAYGAVKFFSRITKANTISLICIQPNLREGTVYDMRIDKLIRECEEAFM